MPSAMAAIPALFAPASVAAMLAEMAIIEAGEVIYT